MGGGTSHTEMGGLWELQVEGSDVCKVGGKGAAQFTTRSSFPPEHVLGLAESSLLNFTKLFVTFIDISPRCQ